MSESETPILILKIVDGKAQALFDWPEPKTAIQLHEITNEIVSLIILLNGGHLLQHLQQAVANAGALKKQEHISRQILNAVNQIIVTAHDDDDEDDDENAPLISPTSILGGAQFRN